MTNRLILRLAIVTEIVGLAAIALVGIAYYIDSIALLGAAGFVGAGCCVMLFVTAFYSRKDILEYLNIGGPEVQQ